MQLSSDLEEDRLHFLAAVLNQFDLLPIRDSCCIAVNFLYTLIISLLAFWF
jgi:hypothetical protein